MKTATLSPANPVARAPALRLFLAGLLLALLGGLALTALAEGGAPPMHGGPHEMMMMGPLHGRMLDHLLSSVNASDAQRQQIKQIAQAAEADLKPQHEQAKALHEQAMKLFTQPVVDASAAEALRQQMMTLHDQSSRRMLQAMLDISRVLTPAQRQQLASTMAQHHQAMLQHRHGHHGSDDDGDDAPPPPPQQ
jgi:Spy/CpxP family protein refolding chaperone